MFHADQIREWQRRIALEDDEIAYRELFVVFYKPLLQFAFSFVRSHETAEEIVSDVFINIWEKRRQLEAIQRLKVYLYVATKNRSLKYLLKQQKQAAVTIDDLLVEPESQYHNPEQLMVTAEMLQRIEAAINGLPPRCKAIFKLVREDGLKYKEIAEILNVSVKTIDNQLAIALTKIANTIKVTFRKTPR
ncbi:RNA polymerase sigma-70 factor [Chitinophaga nivalis]|uniref:RNA polymerase sigma-70 factor n=1 Tax=Chitinophaga nivalis TaxID=2991709 RepID=A0ABT3INC4_9BACT|nr:RNA polymerase sigma-70 factor [Chitinophaga nivalis]MCW3464866.1 RNA polymerase sigma-70 factor [Chitinophaga nivalis]MCW3485443.1 RNA polymerase sigma-70 factor [Chitinophaga nivalis]